MSHRLDDKQARRDARLRAEAAAARRRRLARAAGYAAVGAIASTLIALAALLGGDGPAPAVHPDNTTAIATVGRTAPDFTLTDVVSGDRVSARSLRGRRTMLFFSEGVTCQACMVQAADLEKAGTLRRKGIDLVSITTDDPGNLAQAAKQYGISTPLLADPTTAMSSAYGMLGHGGMGHPTQDGHAFMLLGADGEVLWHKAYQEMYVEPHRLLADMRAEARA